MQSVWNATGKLVKHSEIDLKRFRLFAIPAYLRDYNESFQIQTHLSRQVERIFHWDLAFLLCHLKLIFQ